MARGRLYIDGIDAYDRWGVSVVEGGYDELVAWPPLKTPDSNDWQEHDGIEADLSAPRLDSREAVLKVAAAGPFADIHALVAHLADGAYHDFECARISRAYRLRLAAMPSLDAARLLGFASLRLADDFPRQGHDPGLAFPADYEYEPPSSALPDAGDYYIDGLPLAHYGARALQGTASELLRAPDVKAALLRRLAAADGADYDRDADVTFRSRDAKLTLLFRAPTLDALWQNYDAMLHDLTLPGERTLHVAEAGVDIPCHYKSAAVGEFFPDDGGAWLRLALTLTLTDGGARIADGDNVLAAEDYATVLAEDGESAVDLLPTVARAVPGTALADTDALLAAEAGAYLTTADGHFFIEMPAAATTEETTNTTTE